ncbi:BT_3987 domain-containing protein [Dysgonomonas reticulitermitis]
MNKLLKYTYMAAGIAMFVVAAFTLSSCEGEVDYGEVVKGSPENFVYINTQTSASIDVPKNGVQFRITNTPVSSIYLDSPTTPSGEVKVKFVVQCSKIATSDVHVQLALDNSITLDGYSALPAGLTASMSKTDVVIRSGANISTDTVVLSLNSSDLRPLNPGKYLLPVAKIVSATNASMGENPSRVYATVNVNFTNCQRVTVLPGTLVNKAGLGWTATATNASGANVGSNIAQLVDNTTTGNNYYNSGAGISYPLIITVDTKLPRTVKAFMFLGYSTTYAISGANIYTSSDGVTYTPQGYVALTTATTQYVSFYEPVVNCRFIKVECLTGTTQIVMREFQLYQ